MVRGASIFNTMSGFSHYAGKSVEAGTFKFVGNFEMKFE